MNLRLALSAALLALCLFAVALAQNAPENADPTGADDSTSGEAAANENPLGSADETATGEEDPEADSDGEESASSVTDATMERFRPSEEISSDRSVAFPNDI